MKAIDFNQSRSQGRGSKPYGPQAPTGQCPTDSKQWPSRLGRYSIVLLLGGVLWGCAPGQFRTPRPSLTNRGVNSIFPDQYPSFSSNGRYLVFSSVRGGSEDVYLYDLQQRQLVELPGLNSEETVETEPSISADGRIIVYISNSLGKSEVFLYDRQSRRIENISSRRPGDVRSPAISADGRLIAYESNGSGQWDIELYDRSAGAAAPPTVPPSTNSSP